MKRIAISAAEHSGDLLGASLMQSLNNSGQIFSFFGLSGHRMRAMGCEPYWDIAQVCVMGFVEVIKKIPSLLHLQREMINMISHEMPDLFIGVDAPDFNFSIEKKLKERGIKTVHFISPSIWAWRAYRLKKIKRSTDLILCVFPFEAQFYQQHNMPAVFVGHPLANQLQTRVKYQKTGNILLMPGSRASEIKAILPSLLSALPLILNQKPSLTFSLALLDEQLLPWIKTQIKLSGVKIDIAFKQSHAQLEKTDLVLTASGTATLEALIMGVPMVVVHKLPTITYHIAKQLIKIPYVSLPNILYKQALVPELIQTQANSQNIATQALKLIKSDNQTLIAKFHHIAQTLKQDNSVIVNAINDLLNDKTLPR